MNMRYNTLITGALGGIGRALTAELAKVSDRLVLMGRQESALASFAEMLKHAHPQLQVHILAGDLNDFEYLQQAGNLARALNINLLINNAGANHFGSYESLGMEQQAQLIQTNLIVPMALTKIMLPILLKQQESQVVQVGSILGYIGYPGNVAYCASKFGLRGYAQALARELSDSPVRVKYFAPRATRTAINAGPVQQLNQELKVQEDPPEFVAKEFMQFLQSKRFERKIGFPERLFVLLNQLFPFINDKAIKSQLPTIQKYFLEQNQ